MRRLAHHDLARHLPVARRVRRVVEDHRRGEPFFRRRARRHPVRRDHRHGRAVGDELLDRLAGVVQVGRLVRPVFDDVVVVRHLDEVEVHGAHFRHALEEIGRERLPADAPGVGRAALPGLEHVPFERERWRDHQRRVDPRQFAGAPHSGRPGRLRTERCSCDERSGRDACGRFEEVAPRGIGPAMSVRSAHVHHRCRTGFLRDVLERQDGQQPARIERAATALVSRSNRSRSRTSVAMGAGSILTATSRSSRVPDVSVAGITLAES